MVKIPTVKIALLCAGLLSLGQSAEASHLLFKRFGRLTGQKAASFRSKPIRNYSNWDSEEDRINSAIYGMCIGTLIGSGLVATGGLGYGIMRDTSFSKLTPRGQKTREFCKTVAKAGGGIIGLSAGLGACVAFPPFIGVPLGYGLYRFGMYRGKAKQTESEQEDRELGKKVGKLVSQQY
jgi:hypothetical protein